MKTFQVLITIVSIATITKCELFSTPYRLRHLQYIEKRIAASLHTYIKNEEQNIAHAKRFLKNAYSKLPQNISSITDEEFIGNPIQAFQLIKLLSIEWNDLQRAMEFNHWDTVKQLVDRYEKKGLLPTEDDLIEVALAAYRLEDIYQLNKNEKCPKKHPNLVTGAGLTAQELLFLGKNSLKRKFYKHAIKWFRLAVEKVEIEKSKTGREELDRLLSKAIEEHNDLFDGRSLYYIREQHDTFGSPITSKYKHDVDSLGLEKRKPLSYNSSYPEIVENFKTLCREDLPVTNNKLYCRLDTLGHPYLLIQPVKTEQKSLHPYIVQHYDILTSNQVETLKKLNAPLLSSFSNANGFSIKPTVKTSYTWWLYPDDHPLYDQLYKLTEILMGLSTDAYNQHTEVAIINKYDVGGHFSLHHDFLNSDADKEFNLRTDLFGDRTASLLYYLSDVPKGGATAFPMIGVKGQPMKGSAIWWYNVKKNGQQDELTLHGSCPVVQGSKWIVALDVRANGQIFRRKCDLNPDL